MSRASRRSIGNLLKDHKTTSPALKVKTTNLTSGESVKYTATGVSRYTVAIDENGAEYFEVVSTGQNLLFSTELGGLFFVRGTVDYAVTLDLPENQQEVRPFVPQYSRNSRPDHPNNGQGNTATKRRTPQASRGVSPFFQRTHPGASHFASEVGHLRGSSG